MTTNKHKATITIRHANGVERVKVIEEQDLLTFYARITGTVEGAVRSDSHIVNLEVSA